MREGDNLSSGFRWDPSKLTSVQVAASTAGRRTFRQRPGHVTSSTSAGSWRCVNELGDNS